MFTQMLCAHHCGFQTQSSFFLAAISLIWSQKIMIYLHFLFVRNFIRFRIYCCFDVARICRTQILTIDCPISTCDSCKYYDDRLFLFLRVFEDCISCHSMVLLGKSSILNNEQQVWFFLFNSVHDWTLFCSRELQFLVHFNTTQRVGVVSFPVYSSKQAGAFVGEPK